MKYKGVTRNITIYFRQLGNAGTKYAIDVCPEHAEAVVGDEIVWQVQNASRGVDIAKVGNFRRLDPPPHILLHRGQAAMSAQKKIEPSGKKGMAHTVNITDVGYHKYDILIDGQSMLDPDLEIRGPR
jgi:hypothetical protein